MTEISQQVSSKPAISCPLTYDKCMWKGQYDRLSQHITDCHSEPVARIINEFLTENKTLEDQLSHKTIQITEEQNEIIQLKENENQQIIQIAKQHNEKQHLEDEEKQQLIELAENQKILDDLIKPFNEQKAQITAYENEMLQLEKNAELLSIHLSEKLIGPLSRSSLINIHPNAKWSENGLTVAQGNRQISGINKLSSLLGLDVDIDQTIYVADYENHCILEWKCGAKIGNVVVGGNGTHQLNHPVDVIIDKERDSLIISDHGNRRVLRWPRRNGTNGETIISNISCWGLTIDDNGSLYVVDKEKSEVRRCERNDMTGTVVAGGNGHGYRLDQLNHPHYVFVDRNHSVYVSDPENNRVMEWKEGAKQGIVVAGGQESASNFNYLSGPEGVVVDQLGNVYVADRCDHEIVCWPKGNTQGNVIVGKNRRGERSNQLSYPVGLSFDRHGNLYVVDNDNNRIQKFQIEQPTNS